MSKSSVFDRTALGRRRATAAVELDGDSRVMIKALPAACFVNEDEAENGEVSVKMPALIVQSLIDENGDRLFLQSACRRFKRTE